MVVLEVPACGLVVCLARFEQIIEQRPGLRAAAVSTVFW